MSALYGTLSGERNPVTKCGHKILSGHIRGWNSGVLVLARHTKNGDEFEIYKTHGSNGPHSNILIGIIKTDGSLHYSESNAEAHGRAVALAKVINNENKL